jgi:beta-glucanase (GH16 family)
LLAPACSSSAPAEGDAPDSSGVATGAPDASAAEATAPRESSVPEASSGVEAAAPGDSSVTDALAGEDSASGLPDGAPALDATDGPVEPPPSDAAAGSEGAASAAGCAPGGNHFTDPFDTFDTTVWRCEYSCPTAANGIATFALLPGIAPNNDGSWSKARYTPRRFTCGRFSARFALGKRPSQPVWWGIALWDDGPNPDQSQFNEINFGITTSESATDTQMRFESTKLGHGVSLHVDTGVNLYDGSYHTGELAYDASRVELYFDGRLLQTITDTSVIPTDPMDFLLGTRLVTTPALTSEFDERVDSTDIEW